MNITKSFALYLESIGVATLGQTLFIGEAPNTNKVDNPVFWLVSTGGNKTTQLSTGESVKLYQFNLYYRSREYGDVYDTMFELERQLNCSGCETLQGFDNIETQASVLSIDSDLDNEDRKIGLLQTSVTIFENCN